MAVTLVTAGGDGQHGNITPLKKGAVESRAQRIGATLLVGIQFLASLVRALGRNHGQGRLQGKVQYGF